MLLSPFVLSTGVSFVGSYIMLVIFDLHKIKNLEIISEDSQIKIILSQYSFKFTTTQSILSDEDMKLWGK